MKKRSRIISLLFAVIMVLSITLLAGCSKDNSQEIVLTINDEDVPLHEAMYYIYMAENQFGQIISYENWQSEVSDGKSLSELTKDYVYQGLEEMQILYLEGKAAGIEVPAELETQLKSSAVEYYNSLSEELIEITGLNEQNLYELSVKNYISLQHQNSMVAGLDIDGDAIISQIDKEEFRQYNTQYLHIPFVSTDSEGNETTLTDEEKAVAKENLENALKEVQEGKTFEEIKENDKYEALVHNIANFSYGDEYIINTQYQDVAIELENDDLTDEVIETEEGYYIILMLDNNSDELYNAAVNKAITEKQQELYQIEIDKLKENYTITLNEEVWGPLELGRITINLDADATAEDVDGSDSDSDAAGETESSQ